MIFGFKFCSLYDVNVIIKIGSKYGKIKLIGRKNKVNFEFIIFKVYNWLDDISRLLNIYIGILWEKFELEVEILE